MYEKFETLLKNRKVNAQTVARMTGIAPSTFSDWKSGRSKPKLDKLYKIARYFDISVEYFCDEAGSGPVDAPLSDQVPQNPEGKQ